MKNLNLGKIIAVFQSLFTKKNHEWILAKSHKMFDTSNVDLRRDMSVIHH